MAGPHGSLGIHTKDHVISRTQKKPHFVALLVMSCRVGGVWLLDKRFRRSNVQFNIVKNYTNSGSLRQEVFK